MNRCIYLCILICISCGTRHEPLFQSLTSSESGIDFVNEVKDTRELNIINYRNFYNGGGVGIGDINNDGLPDIFFTSNMGDNKLYLNKGGLTFTDITESAGVKGSGSWSTGVAMADINGDGWLDIYVCNAGKGTSAQRKNELFINQGNLTFQESAGAYGLADPGITTHVAFFDYDKDGDLDVYVLNNSFIPVSNLGYRNLRHERDSLGGDKLYQNTNNHFSDVSDKAGIHSSVIGFGLGITVGDVNNDNWPDLYVSNDFYERDYLYINNQNGTFVEDLPGQMMHTSLASMGADMADVNNDGLADIFVTDMLPTDQQHLNQTMTWEGYDLYDFKVRMGFHHQLMQNALQINNGDSTFSEVARLAGLEATDWSWGALLSDMDGDGLKDLFVANGIGKDITDQDFLKFMADENRMEQVRRTRQFDFRELVYEMPTRPMDNFAFQNLGELNFKNVSSAWGIAGPGFSNGSAYGDLDNDGDLDLVVNNLNSTASIFKNLSDEQNENNYLGVNMQGDGLNKQGIGTTITIFYNGNRQVLQQMPNRGFQSSVDPRLLFGLGSVAEIDSMHVVWPDDRFATYYGLKANQYITVTHNEATRRWRKDIQPVERKLVSAHLPGLDYQHKENSFQDFDWEPLLKQKYSTRGPAVATGDINGDGLTDVIFGGAKGNQMQLFIQQSGKQFTQRKIHAFQNPASEIVDLEWVDVDNDEDLDLIAITGGNEFTRQDTALYDRLYRNDGKGNLTFDKSFPAIPSSGSCVAPADFDHDGDIDLFIGGALVPGAYGVVPDALLLVNDGTGKFSNQTNRFLTDRKIGMTRDAVWQDLNGDGYPELIVVGEWMSIQIFYNKEGKGLLSKKEIAHSNGFWNCIYPTDIHQDGDVDFIIGNLGLNTKWRADSVNRLRLYTGDFGSGASKSIMSVERDGKEYPLVLKHDLERQLPQIKKRFLTYSSYGDKEIREVFLPRELESAEVKTVVETRSCVLQNLGNDKFTLEPLPRLAQVAPIHAIVGYQPEKTGAAVYLLAGNFYDVTPETGRYDASFGTVLSHDPAGKLNAFPLSRWGSKLNGQIRALRVIAVAEETWLLAAPNNDTIQTFKFRE